MSLKFSRTHEWVSIEDTVATLGITEYAQKSLGDIVFVELPKVGAKIFQLEQFGTIESTKAASELYAPLTGEVLETNQDLLNNPQWINEDAQGKGWMLKVKISNPQEVASLMDETQYKTHVASEAH